jgi:serine/threonine protein kinase
MLVSLTDILLDARGIAKVGDFGVSHIFEKEPKLGAERMACINEYKRFQGSNKKAEKSFSDSWSVSSSSSLEEIADQERRSPKLTRRDTDAALCMRGMAGFGMLSKTEGTWCFWSPEMCEGSQSFSGYAADMWAAGVCLFIFVTGKLPFYSEIPQELFDTIADSDISYEGLGLSTSLLDLLKRCLEKDPNQRAGVGDCLKHPFLQGARQKRIKQLSEEFEISSKKTIVISEEDLRSAFRTVTSVPVQVLRSAGKKIQEGLAHTRDRLSISTSTITDGDTLVKHFQEGIHHLRTRMPSMGSTVHSGDGDSTTGEALFSKHVRKSFSDQQHQSDTQQEPHSPPKQKVMFFRRRASDDSDHSLRTFDGNSPVPFDKPNECKLVSRVSRLSSGVSNSSNVTDEMPTTLLEGDNEEETEKHKDNDTDPATDVKHVADTQAIDTNSPYSHTLGHRNEAPINYQEKAQKLEKSTKNYKKRRKGDDLPMCTIQ